MSQKVQKILTTKNKKGFSFTDPRLAEAFPDFKPETDEIAVLVEVEVPDNAEEAGQERFYGSEDTVSQTLKNDWARVCMNAGRPILRESESELDWVTEAQNAADQYRPGRRGGFAPKVTEDEVDQFDNIDDLKAFLKSRRVVAASAE